MREAVIVSTARTGLAKSGRGGFNNTGGVAMSGHAIKHSIERAGIDAAEVEEVVLGCGTPQGTTGNNIGRVAALKAFHDEVTAKNFPYPETNISMHKKEKEKFLEALDKWTPTHQ